MSTRHEVIAFTDADALAHEAARAFVRLAAQAQREHGHFSVALSGGSSPRGMYALLADAYRAQVDWAGVHLFFVDERCVPPDDAQSNYGMIHDVLLRHVPIPPHQVYRMRGEIAPQLAADDYHAALEAHFGGAPTFDALFLGMGDDGHTASLFPNTAALNVADQWVTPNFVPKLGAWRLTLTYATINRARALFVLVGGANKAALVDAITAPNATPHYPIQGVVPLNGQPLTWWIERPH